MTNKYGNVMILNLLIELCLYGWGIIIKEISVY